MQTHNGTHRCAKAGPKKYYEKNREKLLAYQAKYWQLNKHKWNRGEAKQPESNEPESGEERSD